MKIFNFNVIYPIFDVESIGDGPRAPRARLEAVCALCYKPSGSSAPAPYSVNIPGLSRNVRQSEVN